MQTDRLSDKPFGRVFTFVAGVVVLGVAGVVLYSAIVGLKTGEISEISKRHADMVSRRDDSIAFWFSVGLRSVFALFIASLAVPILKDALRRGGRSGQ